MAYQSLYRKYRPQQFAEVVGQHHVTSAIRNAVRDDRVGHAYLFSGPRGTGKTTTARLLAKALNCTNRAPDGDACGVCDNCVGIAEGRFLDLFELDAASNNGVDAIRDLTESVHLGLGPTSTFKVYLIDEVHMLSGGASNALLKTLEEPPTHVVFILATTSPEKVLPTIRSRTQHFDFTLYSLDEISGHLARVSEQEGIGAEPEALEILARAAAGSMRDALSLLDQAIAHGALDVDQVSTLFGGTEFEMRMQILDAIADEDTAGTLIALGELLDAGFDPRRITEDILATARDAFLVTAARGRVRVDAPESDVAALATLGDRTGAALLVRTLETLGQAIVDMRGTDAADPRLVLEIALVRLARRDAGPPLQALAERVDRIERALHDRGAPSSGSAAGVAPADPPPSTRSGPRKTIGARKRERVAEEPPVEPAPEPAPDPEPPADPPPAAETPAVDARAVEARAVEARAVEARAVEIDDVIVAWGDILASLPPATKAAAQQAQPIALEDDVITFGVAPGHLGNAKPRFQKEADNIRDALTERLGRRLRFQLVADEGFDADPSGSPSAGHDAPAEVDEDVVDIAELEHADADGAAIDSVSHVSMTLGGATVVEEIPHD